MIDEPFSGKDFPRTPMEPDELARHREAHHRIKGAWATIEAVDRMSKGFSVLRNIVLVAGILGGGIAWMVSRGMF